MGPAEWHFVSRHPSLWKPGAASPRPSNEALSGAGRRAIVRGLEGNQQERERECGPLRFPGWRAVPAALAGLARGGREAEKTGPGRS